MLIIFSGAPLWSISGPNLLMVAGVKTGRAGSHLRSEMGSGREQSRSEERKNAGVSGSYRDGDITAGRQDAT